MRKIGLILALSILSIMAVAQKSYTIYDWKGQVLVKEYKGKQWHPVQKNQAVGGLDSVSIEKNAVLRVIDNRSNLIFCSTSTGKMRIFNIINDAKKQNSNTLSSVNRELLSGDKSASNKSTMQMTGATTRATDDEALMDSMLQTFGWLARMALQGELTGSSSDLRLISHDTSDGTWFEMQNASVTGYYVNVLHVNKQSGEVNLGYIIEQSQEADAPFLYLPQGEQMQLQNLVFGIDPANDIFILVGTEDPYIPEQLQSVLQYLDISTAQPQYSRYAFAEEK